MNSNKDDAIPNKIKAFIRQQSSTVQPVHANENAAIISSGNYDGKVWKTEEGATTDKCQTNKKI